MLILCVDYEAAGAALIEGAAKSDVSLGLRWSVWSAVTSHALSVWTGRVPSEVNPADAPSGGKEFQMQYG